MGSPRRDVLCLEKWWSRGLPTPHFKLLYLNNFSKLIRTLIPRSIPPILAKTGYFSLYQSYRNFTSVNDNCPYIRPLEPLIIARRWERWLPKKYRNLPCQVLRTLPPVHPVSYKASFTKYMLNDAIIGFDGV